jgi:hypothetical protein
MLVAQFVTVSSNPSLSRNVFARLKLLSPFAPFFTASDPGIAALANALASENQTLRSFAVSRSSLDMGLGPNAVM